MIVTRDPVEIEVPHERGNFFGFARVAWPVLRRARKVQTHESIETASKMTGALLEALQSKDDNAAENAQKLIEANKYHPDQYDTETLLCGVDGKGGGVVSFRGPDYDGIAFSPEALMALDEATSEWAKKEILDLTCPTEDQEKNDSPD